MALAGAFAFASTAYAAPGGVKGKPGGTTHAAFNAFVADPVPCADAVAIVPEGMIAVGVDEPQCYTYDMVIEDAEVGSVHRDELTANWDLDGASEAAVDDASGFGGDGAAEDAATGGGAGGVSAATEDGATGTVAGVVDAGTEEDAVDGVVDDDCNATDGGCDGLPVDACPSLPTSLRHRPPLELL